MKIKKKYKMPTLEVVECYGNMALCSGSGGGGITPGGTSGLKGDDDHSTEDIF